MWMSAAKPQTCALGGGSVKTPWGASGVCASRVTGATAPTVRVRVGPVSHGVGCSKRSSSLLASWCCEELSFQWGG